MVTSSQRIRRRSRVAAVAAAAVLAGGVAAGCGGDEEQAQDPIDQLNEEFLKEASTSPEDTVEQLEDFDGREAVEDIQDALNE